MIIVSEKASDMYKADACKMQASAFFRCRKITDANVLDGFFKRLEIYPEMKTERFTAVKRSVLYEYHRICVRRSFMLYCSEIRMSSSAAAGDYSYSGNFSVSARTRAEISSFFSS